MSDKPKILSNTAKGIGNLAGEAVKEATKQVGKAAEEAATELVGGGGSSNSDDSQTSLTIDQLKQMNQGKADEEIAELQRSISEEGGNEEKPKISPKKAPQLGGRDVDQEIQEVRKKKKKKEKEEEELLERVKEQREREKEEALQEAQSVSPGEGVLDQTGSRKKRGTVLIDQRGKKEIKGGKH